MTLTRIGPGKRMWDHLQRYWHSIAGVSEFEQTPVKRARLFGEDLVLFRDLGGNFG
jgi:5,5'-dehydrodivanillate O-demethylase